MEQAPNLLLFYCNVVYYNKYMNHKLLRIGTMFLSILLVGCSFSGSKNKSSSFSNKQTSISTSFNEPERKKYRITWQNHDGTVLEVDEEVPEGEMPHYDGPTPEYNDIYNDLVFHSWYPDLEPVRYSTVYTATYGARPLDNIDFDYQPVEGGYRLNISAQNKSTLSYQHSLNLEHSNELVEVYVGNNIEKVQQLEITSPILKKITFSSDVKQIVSLYISDGQLEGIYFEGDAPKIRQIRHANVPEANVYMPYIYYDKSKKGWDKYAISGCILKPIGEPEYVLPDYSLSEWAIKMVEVSNERVKTIYEGMHDNGEEELFMLPSENDLIGNPIIKAFTENLTKDLTTTVDKIDAIYNWVSTNITYDVNYQTANSYKTFTEKRGVCAQYTNLMRDMLGFINIPSCAIQCVPKNATTIKSYKELLVEPHSSDFPGETHILLAVLENDKVFYYDPTWHNAYKDNYAKVRNNYYLFAVNYVDITSEVIPMSSYNRGDTPMVAYADGHLYGFINGHITDAGGQEFMTNFAFNQVFVASMDDGYRGFDYCELIRSNFSGDSYLPQCTYSRSDGLSYNIMQLCQFFMDDKPNVISKLLEKHNIDTIKKVGDYLVIDNTISMYLGKDKDVAVPYKLGDVEIKEIGYLSFSDNHYIETITFQQGITSIKNGAIYNCQNLKTVTIPDSMGSDIVLDEAITNRYGVDLNPVIFSLNFEEYIVSSNNQYFKSINGALYSKNEKYLISVPPKCNKVALENVNYILNETFANTCIKEITIPSNIVLTGQRAFAYSEALTSVIFESNATKELDSTFISCPNLNHVELPNGWERIPLNEFAYCFSLYDIELPDSIETIGDWAFLASGLVHINLPRSLTSIGNDAFYECKKLFDVDNYSSLALTLASNDNGGVAKYAKDISQSKYVKNNDNFIFYSNGSNKALMSYVGEIENNSLTLPNSVDGEKYRINNFFFVEGSEMLYNIGAGTRSFVTFNGFTHLHDVKTIYVPAGIEYQDSVFPKTVSVVTV